MDAPFDADPEGTPEEDAVSEVLAGSDTNGHELNRDASDADTAMVADADEQAPPVDECLHLGHGRFEFK